MKRSPSAQAISSSISEPSSVAAQAVTADTGYRIMSNRPSSLCGNSTIADAGEGSTLPGGSGTQFRASPVPGITPVDGWHLFAADEPDSDGFRTHLYIARKGDRDVVLDVSRFAFTPTNDRFAWLVRGGFPPRPTPFGGWSDIQIETRIALEPEMAEA